MTSFPYFGSSSTYPNPNRPFPCDLCNRVLPTLEAFVRHFDEHLISAHDQITSTVPLNLLPPNYPHLPHPNPYYNRLLHPHDQFVSVAFAPLQAPPPAPRRRARMINNSPPPARPPDVIDLERGEGIVDDDDRDDDDVYTSEKGSTSNSKDVLDLTLKL